MKSSRERTSDSYVLRSIAVSPRSQADTWNRQSLRRHAVMGAGGTSGCQGTSWSEELDGKELHGIACGDLEPREPAASSTSSTPTRHELRKHLRMWYYAVFSEWCFLRVLPAT